MNHEERLIYENSYDAFLRILNHLDEARLTLEQRKHVLAEYVAESNVKVFKFGYKHGKKSNVKQFDFANMHTEPRDIE